MNKKQYDKEVEKIEGEILDLLRSLGNAALMQYRDLFFRIFRNAYEHGCCCPLRYNFHVDTGRTELIRVKGRTFICGESIRTSAIKSEWVTREEEGKRYKQLRLIGDWWNAWTYTLESIGHKQQCQRSVEKEAEQ